MKLLNAGLFLALAISAAPVTFKTAHEISGLRSILTVWQPEDSLAAHDLISTMIVSALDGIDISNDTVLDEMLLKFGDKFSEKAVNATEAYSEDLTDRWKAMTPDAREFLTQQGEIIKNAIANTLELKLPWTIVQYLMLDEEVRNSIKSSFPALVVANSVLFIDHGKIAGAFEKIAEITPKNS